MNSYHQYLLSVAVLVIGITGCASESDTETATTDTESSTETATPGWSYEEGPTGPENWATLRAEYAPCNGKSQSPINIPTGEVAADESLSPLEVNYGTTPVEIINNGHTVQFNVSGDYSLSTGDKEYELLQFHYHVRSERTIDGEHYPLEIHFVHRHSDTDYAVLGMMYQPGVSNTLLADYLPFIPTEIGAYRSESQIDLSTLIPAELTYFHYDGSLTTPPCSEVVNWYLLQNPVEASTEQLDQMTEILDGNYRPVMPLNDREILGYGE
ncbi:MAG: carbonic anhydrase family protein [Balneolaceae bacterium]|nr:carbonic anhydrase family protein [Balneolaceae bacterium]